MRQRYLERLLRGQRQLLQSLRVQAARIEDDPGEPVRLRVVHTGQRQPGTLALQDVMTDARATVRNGRQRIHVGIEVRAVDVVVSTAPQHVAQFAGYAERFRAAHVQGIRSVKSGSTEERNRIGTYRCTLELRGSLTM